LCLFTKRGVIMFYNSELIFLQKTLSRCNLQNMILNPKNPLSNHLDDSIKRIFGGEYQKTFYDYFPNIEEKTIYRVTDFHFCNYIFMLIPFNTEKRVFAVGPYLRTDLTPQQVLELGERLGIPAALHRELEYFYAAMPVVTDEIHIHGIINTFAETIWNGDDSYRWQDINRESAPLFPADTLNVSDGANVDIDFDMMEKRYAFENELMDAVSKGNVHKAENMMSSFSSLAFEMRVTDRLRNMKNYCIIMNTLLRKAAEKGGVHPIYIDRMSSSFAGRIENLHTLSAITDFMTEMLRSYCKLVRQHSIANLPLIVQKAIVTIDSDLTKELSLEALAKESGVSKSYFSSLFKKATGSTLTEFVNRKRISYAKHLLKNTGLQIQTIAQHCGVLDLHYFCRLFKQITGQTPSEYRGERAFK